MSGPIVGASGETWSAVGAALQKGSRGFKGGSSLAKLLAEHRGRRNQNALPKYTHKQILAWADAHHQRTGDWPKVRSGPIVDAPGETWKAVGVALQLGLRGLKGGASLAQLLAEHRGVRNRLALPKYTHEQILAWADAHHQRTGAWPNQRSGAVDGAPGETWEGIQSALRVGFRGLSGGSSLFQLLQEIDV